MSFVREFREFAMSRFWWRNCKKDMSSSFEKNILSDPTSDGNVQEEERNGAVPSVRAPSPSYRYEEFDRRAINEHDSDSLTQTCPTCGGSGKLTKGMRIKTCNSQMCDSFIVWQKY